nr:MAG TPA: hypothetical protein [Caudoviricetes sp.]
MIDFLKAHPQITRDEYLWEWTVPQVELATIDNTHVEYLSEEQAKIERGRVMAEDMNSEENLMNDLGISIL